jgi:hypothetical protein
VSDAANTPPPELIPKAERPIAEEALRDPVKRGFISGAYSKVLTERSPRNISSHKTAGIGAWTDAEIKRALTQGIDRDGRAFKPPMARQVYFSKMTDEDVDAIVA